MTTTFWLEHAWLGPRTGDPDRASSADTSDVGGSGSGGVADSVVVTVEGGRFTSVEPATAPPPGADRLPGLTVPGMANCHSHAFHRGLRGRTQRGRGTFWTWRKQMYALAERLDPDTCYALARATYREMVLSGYTSVGEFHYLHHGRDGTPYDDPNALGLAMVEAARDAGIRIALLDTCYLASGTGTPPEGVQVRFSDGDADRWASRVERLVSRSGDDLVVGAAVHSVRAVPPEQMRVVAKWADAHEAPLHVHLSEQVAENAACLAAYSSTPTRLLQDAGVLGERTSVVHATHLSDGDVAALGDHRVYACFCPTTERDLGDGIGPSRRLRAAGATLTLGSDSHAVIDPFEEMRAVELNERLDRQERGHWAAEELLVAGTADGHRSLGFGDVGRIEVGARADLVTLDLRSHRTAGAGAAAETAVFAAAGADVVQVVRDGRVVATAEERSQAGHDLDTVISSIWERR